MLLDRCIFNPVSAGTGSFVVSAAKTGYLTPAQALVTDGATLNYAAETRNTATGAVTAWEVGSGTYTAGTTTLTRASILFSSNGNLVVNFASAPDVMITALATDFVAGSNTQVMFNDAGVLAGDSGLTYSKTNKAITLGGATVTTSNPVLNLSQTWNNAAVTFTGLRFNATNTASAAASLLLDLQVGGIGKFQVDKSGDIYVANSSYISIEGPGGAANIQNLSGFMNISNLTGGNGISFSPNGANATAGWIAITSSRMAIKNTFWFGWSSTDDVSVSGTFDLQIYRDAAGILAQRNSTNAQTFRIYNTFTDASNYERGVFDWTTTANTLTIGTQNLGTGTARAVNVVVGAYTFVFTAPGNITVPNTVFANNVADANPANWVASTSYGGFTLANGQRLSWGSTTDALGARDTGFARSAAGVVEINNGTKGTLTGSYLQWGGQSRVSGSDFSTGANNTTLANVTGLSVTVVAGRTYSFDAYLSCTCAAAGGVKAAISGVTTSATAIEYDGWIIDSAANGIKGNTQATALGTAVATSTTTGTAVVIQIKGTITVNVGGTLTVQFAQNTNNATASLVKIGSYFIVHDMP